MRWRLSIGWLPSGIEHGGGIVSTLASGAAPARRGFAHRRAAAAPLARREVVSADRGIIPMSTAARHRAALMTDRLLCGDNLALLPALPDRCIDLVAIDPPFNSNRDYAHY